MTTSSGTSSYVIGETPIITRYQHKQINVLDIQTLWQRFCPLESDPQTVRPPQYEKWEVWSSSTQGWTPIQYVHKKVGKFPTVCISTISGMVVTDQKTGHIQGYTSYNHGEHKDDKSTSIPVSRIKPGDVLVSSFPSPHEFQNSENLFTRHTVSYQKSTSLAKVLGIFMGTGDIQWTSDSWVLDLRGRFVSQKKNVVRCLKRLFPRVTFDSRWEKKCILVSRHTRLILFFQAVMYNDKHQKRVPTWIMNGTEQIRQAFWLGLVCNQSYPSFPLRFHHALTAMSVYTFLRSMGYKSKVYYDSIVYVVEPDIIHILDENVVTQVKPMDNHPVHELFAIHTTEKTHQAGVGALFVVTKVTTT